MECVCSSRNIGSFQDAWNDMRVQVGTLEKDGKKKLQLFTLFLTDYLYSPATGTFVAVSAMPLHLPDQICSALAALHLINQGMWWSQMYM